MSAPHTDQDRKTVYIVVTGTASEDDDFDIPGVYAAGVDPGLLPAEMAECALDQFHEAIGIECLDDFEITPMLADGTPLPRLERYEPFMLADSGDWREKLSEDEQPEAVRAYATRARSATPDDTYGGHTFGPGN